MKNYTTTASPAPDDNRILAGLIARVEATRFDPAKPPQPEPWVLTLGGVEIAHPGNLVTVSGATKAGKSSAVAAMLASLFGVPGGDYLGFSGRNHEGKTVLHFDTEQSRGDHHQMMKDTLRRARIKEPPAWFKSYSIVPFDPSERWAVIHAMALRAHDSGGLLGLFIDGVADLAFDVNNSEEARGLVADLHRLATATAAVIVTALHHNPGSEKSRGHLGSEIERKSESVLTLRKAGVVISISCQPARHEELAGGKAPRFAWDTEHKMHRSVTSKAEDKDEQKRADLTELAEKAFGGKGKIRWGELQRYIKKARSCSSSTASTLIKEMLQLAVIGKNQTGFYSVKRQ